MAVVDTVVATDLTLVVVVALKEAEAVDAVVKVAIILNGTVSVAGKLLLVIAQLNRLARAKVVLKDMVKMVLKYTDTKERLVRSIIPWTESQALALARKIKGKVPTAPEVQAKTNTTIILEKNLKKLSRVRKRRPKRRREKSPLSKRRRSKRFIKKKRRKMRRLCLVLTSPSMKPLKQSSNRNWVANSKFVSTSQTKLLVRL